MTGHLHQIAAANRHPLNRRALILLQRAKQEPVETSLHLLNLITWAMESRAPMVDLVQERADEMLAAAYELMGATPARVMEQFDGLHPTMLEDSPKAAAATAAEYLHHNLKKHLPELRSDHNEIS